MPFSAPSARWRQHRRPLSVALVAGAVAIPVMVAAGLQPAAAASLPGRATLVNAPGWTASTAALGPAAGSVSFSVAIAPRDAAGAQAFADSVSDPRSASYRHFITPQQYTARFGATATDVASVAGGIAKVRTANVEQAEALANVTATLTAARDQPGTGQPVDSE